ncbi:hypothetical protein CYMTET_50627 [Cymbomonas tetramitiformis]|uniref:Uncharacterized protein n=1 Tax=Cymbomonas tetramitiformis TaxID=36881 RepID=A0AAE0ESZ3_9CHLO|nr:hypothetical protein CYMTET_50627 [Cymbomonas tetramitiformis]
MAVNGSWHFGFYQHETSCTVVDLLPTSRMIFILAIVFSSLGLRVVHYDVSGQAFMHARLDVPIYITSPSGYAYQGSPALMAKFGLKPKNQTSPMDEKLIIQRTEHCDEALITAYLSLLGFLLWIARCTWPGISYAVIYPAQFSSCPTDQSWSAL